MRVIPSPLPPTHAHISKQWPKCCTNSCLFASASECFGVLKCSTFIFTALSEQLRTRFFYSVILLPSSTIMLHCLPTAGHLPHPLTPLPSAATPTALPHPTITLAPPLPHPQHCTCSMPSWRRSMDWPDTQWPFMTAPPRLFLPRSS